MGKYLSLTRIDWKRNPHSIQTKRINISYWIYNLIKHILSGYWSIGNVILLSQPFGWFLSSHLSSWLLTQIRPAQINWATPAGSLNIIDFFVLPMGSYVCAIWLVSLPPFHQQSTLVPVQLCQCMLMVYWPGLGWKRTPGRNSCKYTNINYLLNDIRPDQHGGFYKMTCVVKKSCQIEKKMFTLLPRNQAGYSSNNLVT